MNGAPVCSAATRRFDPFVLDVRSRELWTGDRSVMLQAQPFEVLLLLLTRAGEVVDREELRRRLWPDGTFVDYEHGLNAAIKRLRNALGDDAERPRFIETIPRRGYRFVAPVIDSDPVRPRPLPTHAYSIRLAVLPVTHVGADDAFAEGLTEELRVQVGRMSAGVVAVIARSSSTMFERQPRRASEIGEALLVDYLLEGSVRSDGDRLRITIGLVETLAETRVWSESVECCSSGPLAMQVEVATRLAQSLTQKLLALLTPPRCLLSHAAVRLDDLSQPSAETPHESGIQADRR
jgi:DNA-binding winged helix-turn-helix (wHTH) protein